MLFNSIDFAIFLPIVFLLYWFVANKNLKTQNILIVLASYVFYGWWDWRFLSLIFFSTIVDYTIGLLLDKEEDKAKRKIYLTISILVNLGFLGFFKYYNFFLDNFVAAFSFFGNDIKPNRLNIILPVGISFYTFQTMSYTIDVYRKKLKPTKDFISFAAFVSFFPQLVAGPIERATNLLPQFYTKRKFSYEKATDGLRQILWGLFMKVVIADNCAYFANEIFNNSADKNGSTLLLGALFFTFQIYGDFSGYSNIAIGTARLFGFKLMQNFAFPYFSRDMAEFWRRWHISLSTWFRDYLYIPLGGSRGNTYLKIRNTFIIFLVSGFWHGANWTFIVWGALNAIYFLPLLLTKRNRNNLEVVAKGRNTPTPIVKRLETIVESTIGFIYSFFDFEPFKNQEFEENCTKFNGYDALGDKLLDEKNVVYINRHEKFLKNPSELFKRAETAKIDFNPKMTEKYLNKVHLDRISSLIEKFSEKGIHLFILLNMRLNKISFLEFNEILNNLDSSHTIRLYDYNKYPELYDMEYSFDVGHLYKEGPVIYSEYLSIELEKLISKYNLNVNNVDIGK